MNEEWYQENNINIVDRPNWDTVFLSLAFLIAQRSPDAETKHGAVLVDKNNRIISLGFNGFPRGFKDSELPTTRPDKYFWMIHSEENCLDNAHIIPEPENCTLYVTGPCCHECIKRIIQAGIGTVKYAGVTSTCMSHSDSYNDNMKKLMARSKIKFIQVNNKEFSKGQISSLLEKTIKYMQYRWR